MEEIRTLQNSTVPFTPVPFLIPDCRLVVEVADTSLQRDRAKASIYCSAGVEEYWIVNVNDQCLERFQLCRETMAYQETRFAPDQEISIQLGDVLVVVNLQQLFG